MSLENEMTKLNKKNNGGIVSNNRSLNSNNRNSTNNPATNSNKIDNINNNNYHSIGTTTTNNNDNNNDDLESNNSNMSDSRYSNSNISNSNKKHIKNMNSLNMAFVYTQAAKRSSRRMSDAMKEQQQDHHHHRVSSSSSMNRNRNSTDFNDNDDDDDFENINSSSSMKRKAQGHWKTLRHSITRKQSKKKYYKSLSDLMDHDDNTNNIDMIIDDEKEKEKEKNFKVEVEEEEDENLLVMNNQNDNYNQLELVWIMITTKWINVLLFFLPLGYVSYLFDWGPGWIFSLNFLAMIPLASMLGDFTEELAIVTGETIGGLINATFGNAVEVVVAIQALRANELRVVQASMLGSVLSNILLVLGCCFFFGGLRYKEQRFNTSAAIANMGLLMLASLAIIIPAPMGATYALSDEVTLLISRICAVFLILMYLQLLIFQLRSHVHLFVDNGANDNDDENGEIEEEEISDLKLSTSLIGLGIVTLLVSFFSDFLVSSIDGVTAEYGISKTFVGVIILPIVGNAVEHITAVKVAINNKMELAMGVAVGSSVQIAIFVIPVIVLAGWIMGKEMTLKFPVFEIIVFVMTMIIVQVCIMSGISNWLQGSMLITTYIFLSVAFWFEDGGI